MRLWLLERRKEAGWDECDGMVVRAKSWQQARKLAAARYPYEQDIWLSAKKSSCEAMKHDGAAEVIITDFRAA